MSKIIIAVVALIAIAIGWFILNPGDTFDYVVNIDQEVTQLETELADLDSQVAAGTLTSEQATAAKVRIITRLDAINKAATDSEQLQLTPEQRTQLANGLLRLKDALVRYQATLDVVEDTAVEADVTAQLKSGQSGGSRHLTLIVADTIDDVEETVQDSIQGYETDAELNTQIDAAVTEAEAEEAMEEEMDSEESMDGSEESMDDSEAEMTDEEDGMMSEEEPMQEKEMSEGDMEASSEAEIRVVQ